MKIDLSLSDLLFPPVCFGCNTRISAGMLCDQCIQSLEFLDDVCPRCGAYEQETSCRNCQENDYHFDRARSVFRFNKIIKSLIHDLKYNEMKKVASFLGEMSVNFLQKFQPFEQVDLIVPIPLHRVKKRSRGYNQSQLLSLEIAGRMNWLHKPDLIKRSRFTETQTKLGKTEREKNVREAFVLNSKHRLAGSNILIIDDVFTTGSTVNSVSALLKQNGAAKIYVLTIARA